MAIWLGNAGAIRLQRAWQNEVYDHITPTGTNLELRRFGFEDGVTGITTGDRVQFKRVDDDGNAVNELLDFVDASAWADGKQHNDGAWYCHVDNVGGVRLYGTWEAAIKNDTRQAYLLNKPSGRYRVSYKNANANENCLAQTSSWTLNTNRETVDVSGLGDQFRKQFSSLISGSGTIECLFDYAYHRGNADCDVDYKKELPVFMHKLAIRQEVGSNFTGMFLMRQANALPLDELLHPKDMEKELFYLCECVITNVATELSPTELIRSSIDFITTGQIDLLYGLPSNYLLKEDNDFLLQEDDSGILLSAGDFS